MGIGDYSATDADNVTVPGSPPIEIGEGIGGGPTAHHTLRLAIQRIMADLKTLNGTIAGADGFDGTSAGLKYDFNNSTSVADPGTGKFALNNASPGLPTFISVDALTAAATNPDASDWVAAWDDGNGAIKGLVVITEIGAEQKFAIFKATAVVDNTNWLRVAVTHVASNGTFTNDVTCAIAFSPAGADGGDGDDGTDGNTILNGSGAPGGGTGSDGDFYIDTSGNNIYGPKASGAWGSATSIVGAPGDGSGDMVAATYDPNSVEDDAFDMANMVEATTEKIFTATERTKLSGIETGATADQTGAQIKAAYEAEANAYTDTLNTKLASIEASADVTDEANVVASLNGATLTAVTVAGTDKVVVQDASDSDNIKTVTAQSIADLGGGGGSPEGTAVLSTGETGGTKFLREDGDGTSSWQTISGGGDALVANPLSQFAATTSAQLAATISDETGSGALVFGTSPTLVTPALGTPASGVATNLTGTAAGLTAGNVTTNANLTGHITSTGNAAVLGSFTSLQLKTALSDETGSGAAVFATSPTLVTPILGTPTSGTLTNAIGLPIVGGTTGTLSVARGGTGSTTASAARTALGVAIGSDVQAYDADTAKIDVAQTFTAFQSGTNEAMTDGATITPTGTKHYHSVTLGGNRTLANPTTITAGGTYVFKITQDGTGSRTLSWGAAYDWGDNTAPTLTTAANGIDVFSGVSFDGTSIQMVTVGKAFA